MNEQNRNEVVENAKKHLGEQMELLSKMSQANPDSPLLIELSRAMAGVAEALAGLARLSPC